MNNLMRFQLFKFISKSYKSPNFVLALPKQKYKSTKQSNKHT